MKRSKVSNGRKKRAFSLSLFMGIRAFQKTRAETYEDWSMSMAAGDAMGDIFRLSAARAAKSKNNSLRTLYNELLIRLGDPASLGHLSKVLEGVIPISDVLMLQGYERSGKIAEGLMECAKTIKKQAALVSFIKGAMAKPIASLLVVTGVTYYFGKSVLPPFSKMMPPEELDALAKSGFFFAVFVAQHIGYIVLFLIALFALALWLPNNWHGRARMVADQMVPFNVFRGFQSAILLSVLATMTQSGISLDEGLKMLIGRSSAWMKMYLRKISRRLADSENGGDAAAMNVGFFTPYVMWRMEDAIRLKGFSAGLKNVADNSFSQIENQVKASAGVISQLTTMVTGLIIAWLMVTTINYGFALKAFMETSSGA